MVTDTQLKEAKKAITDPTKQTDIKGRDYFTTGHTLLDLVVGGGEGLGYGMGYASGTILRDQLQNPLSKQTLNGWYILLRGTTYLIWL